MTEHLSTNPISAPSVALVSGQWAQNVGNAFFNLGGKYVLERVFGDGAVGYFQDQPNYRTLHNKLKGNPKNYVDFATALDIKYLVVQGPVLNSWLRISWEDTFRRLRDRGVKVIFLSSAFFKFRKEEIDSVRAFLEEFPPALISTRDNRSYEIIENWLPDVPKYAGIDSGFFLNRCFTPFKTWADQHYISVNFDRYPEPTISATPLPSNFDTREIEIEGKRYYLGVPKFLNKYSHRGKIAAYFADLTDRRKLAATFEGRTIVRPEHRFFPHVTHKIYRQPNAFAADEPWTYLNVYANTDFTLSDRVHACVATLAFGKPAMLFTPSPRAALFEALNLSVKDGMATLDLDYLRTRQEAEIAWLKSTLGAAGTVG